MKINLLADATALSDRELLARLAVLAGREREAAAEVVAHLAALEGRPGAYAAEGYGSLFAHCTLALRLSEDAACNRIEAARACRRFPVILDRLASGALSLTTVRVLSRHLTEDNHEAVLVRAQGRSRREIDALVAELAPRPDVPPSVRRLPTSVVRHSQFEPLKPSEPAQVTALALDAPVAAAPSPVQPPPTGRAIVQPTAPERYRIQFTVGQETHEKLRRLQALLRREIPDGDPAAICDRAWSPLIEQVEKAKLGAAVAKPTSGRAIRPGTDRVHKPGSPNRHIPRAVKRTVWERDAGRCAFVSAAGLRCPERTFLEFHHQVPFAKRGPATVANIALRCRRHNHYEADLVFGPRERESGHLAIHDPSLSTQPSLLSSGVAPSGL